MTVKKSNIIIISAISVLLMWCAWNLGIRYARFKALKAEIKPVAAFEPETGVYPCLKANKK